MTSENGPEDIEDTEDGPEDIEDTEDGPEDIEDTEDTENGPEDAENGPEDAEDAEDAEDIRLSRDDAAERYEIRLGERRVGLADYYRRGDVVVIPHTETSPELGGRGLASQLVRYCLDDIRAQGLRVEPACPFVAAYIRKNPEYADLVSRG